MTFIKTAYGRKGKEFVDFLKKKKKTQPEGEIGDEDVEAVAGGGMFDWFDDLW